MGIPLYCNGNYVTFLPAWYANKQQWRFCQIGVIIANNNEFSRIPPIWAHCVQHQMATICQICSPAFPWWKYVFDSNSPMFAFQGPIENKSVVGQVLVRCLTGNKTVYDWMWVKCLTSYVHRRMQTLDSHQKRKIAGCAWAGNTGSVFPVTDFKRNR